ncbi:MAG: hypothetical protein M0C28_14490 [Candidatus Moduliflexus flocculans]|nr:hypothetical protein [Candidatus Moduliflexus flocculans]
MRPMVPKAIKSVLAGRRLPRRGPRPAGSRGSWPRPRTGAPRPRSSTSRRARAARGVVEGLRERGLVRRGPAAASGRPPLLPRRKLQGRRVHALAARSRPRTRSSASSAAASTSGPSRSPRA